MIVRRTNDYEPFKSIDESEITEVIGMATTNTKEVSLALAKIKPGFKTLNHYHNFTEIYMVVEGKGMMHLDDEIKDVSKGDNILIPPKSWHFIENRGDQSLLIWCICTPAFTNEETILSKRSD
ncbi:MAG: cupin domain-containing protein [archaeon]|nr:cupin domain-containing protein [archaeon]